ncbi:glucose 1-dehydrogenase [Planococcus salinus]|uniref:Glucose 1-dehydrogenase n=1 Tax=Planococcus salinus TaxID=1848460 RepID=A0A3M8P5J7_9BACL|nr:glucose 1-dehydrogenase [Planococcus salinus]RNF38949.1 glucose 1-dehydrogenase [Planococcus salinus]
MGRLDGKVAIITGGARGMGASHAKRFSEEGAKVMITDILEKEGEAMATELGRDVKFMKHDVTKSLDWERVVAETESAFGPVSVLVNNAGIALLKSIEKMTEAQYRRVIDINQVSVFLGMKYVLSSMRKTENGSIINISSISGLKGNSESIAYSASKFAIRGMTKSAAIEFGAEGIRVNSVHPGITETPMVRKSRVSKLAREIPLQRTAQPVEVSNMVVYLASDESSYVTGADFVIDGGLTGKL